MIIAVVELLAWAGRRRRRCRVQGRSMEPTLIDGHFVLVDSGRSATVGAVVVARHPERPGLEIIKRVAAIDGDGFDLRSDNAEAGTDSRHFGPVAPAAILGVVTFVLSDPGRRPESRAAGPPR